jgi:3-deoxy-D-manno-octulosonate 8-phosphate phosphatase (KDO 8-P phosphatase)
MALSYKEELNNITTFVLDVDGVLTDGSILVTQEGEMLRNMNIKDGYAMKAAVESGYNLCVISGGSNPGVKIRLQNLGIKEVHLGIGDKVAVLNNYFKTNNINPKDVVYVGDDLPDYHVMQLVGMPVCPQDAVPEIKALSKYISHKNGGKGCVRDIIEQVMKVQGNWMKNFNAKYD